MSSGTAAELQRVFDALDLFHASASHNGGLRVWGRTSATRPHKLVEPTHWQDWHIDYTTVFADPNGEPIRTVPRDRLPDSSPYYDLRLNKAEVESVWPPNPSSTDDGERLLQAAPVYTAAEIGEMITALNALHTMVDKECRSAYEALTAITQRWDENLRVLGPWELSSRLKPIQAAVRGLEVRIDQLLTRLNRYWDELYPVVYPGPHPGDGLAHALTKLCDELQELAGGKDVNVSKWSRPAFDEVAKMATRYGEWVGQTPHRIVAKTKTLRTLR